MRNIPWVVAATVLSAFGTPVLAQGYRPTYAEAAGTELVVVYLSATTCGPCRAPTMPALLDSAKVQLQRQAQARGQHFRAVFVAMDWRPDSALALAREDGLWDELSVGRNWLNAGAQLYIWGDTATTPAMPQLILFEQDITMSGRVTFGERRVLRRVIGLPVLAQWVAQGSPASRPVQPN